MTKSFAVQRNTREAIPFDVSIEDDEGKSTVKQFHAVGSINGRMMLRITGSASLSGPEQAQALYEFFDRVVVPSERPDWIALIEDDAVSLDTLTEILEWLMEQYGNRPTQSA